MNSAKGDGKRSKRIWFSYDDDGDEDLFMVMFHIIPGQNNCTTRASPDNNEWLQNAGTGTHDDWCE